MNRPVYCVDFREPPLLDLPLAFSETRGVCQYGDQYFLITNGRRYAGPYNTQNQALQDSDRINALFRRVARTVSKGYVYINLSNAFRTVRRFDPNRKAIIVVKKRNRRDKIISAAII